MRIGIYPGSFDPPTNGHLDLIRRAGSFTDRLVVAVLVNAQKQPLLTVDVRLALLREACEGFGHVEIDSFSGLLVQYAERKGATFIVRGLRNLSDFDLEFSMAHLNARLRPGLETVLLPASEGSVSISSRLVKEIYSLGGDISPLVPANVARYLNRPPTPDR